jgi:hypothetical protein
MNLIPRTEMAAKNTAQRSRNQNGPRPVPGRSSHDSVRDQFLFFHPLVPPVAHISFAFLGYIKIACK